jgi:tetratricopeptide (TPR) repeat protein
MRMRSRSAHGHVHAAPTQERQPAGRTSISDWLLVRWKILTLGSLFLLAIGLVAYARLSKPLLPVTEPRNPAALDPLLRSYVMEKIAWVRQSPRDAGRRATLGLVYAANGLWPEAQAAFQNTAALDPKEPLAFLYLAVSYQELGQSVTALSVLTNLTARFPTFAPGFFRLGDYSLRLGMVDLARPAFDRLTILAPQEWRGFAGLGEISLRRGDPGEAAKLLEQAVKLEPGAKPAHALLGQAYQLLGKASAARRELALGVNAEHFPMPDAWSAQAPEHMRLLVDLIDMAHESMKKDTPAKAVNILEMARPFHPDNPNLLVTLAQAYTLAGDPGRAQPLLDRTLQLKPTCVPAYVALSGCDLALGRTDEALGNADRAISLATNSSEAYLAKANVLLAQEKDADAVAALDLAHRNDPKNAQILLDAGDVWFRNLNDPNQALALYREAVSTDPSLLSAHLRLASLYARLGDRAAAAAALQDAKQLAPNDPEIAQALQNLNQPPSRETHPRESR